MRLRGTLAAVPAYKPGKPAARPDSGPSYKISSNENPYPPLPSVVQAIAEAAQQVNRYPDMGVTALTDAIATRFEVDRGQVATGTGSVGVLSQLVTITCSPGDEIVYAWRSFEAYPIVASLAGATSVQVPLTPSGEHDLEAMASAVSARTRLVLVCTPNNPTGPSVTETALREFLAGVPQETLVVIDEAYLEFNTDTDAPDALALVREYPNVAVLRTFSKAYGLAGLRIGYAVAPVEVATALRKAATPFGVSDVAQHAAIASLDAFDELQTRVAAIVAQRSRVYAALVKQGWDIPDTQANFVWFPLGEHSLDFAAAAAKAGLAVRAFAGEGVRATIGEIEANDLLIEVASDFRDSVVTIQQDKGV